MKRLSRWEKDSNGHRTSFRFNEFLRNNLLPWCAAALLLFLPSLVLSAPGDINTITDSAIQLPRTGQTMCYDTAGAEIACSGTGQDGEIQAGVAWPNPRFTDNGDQSIRDNLTGLVWTRDADTPTVGSCTGGTKTWQGALDYVACLNSNNYLGHNDWRLPNVNELESLVNAEEVNSAAWLNSQGFTYVDQSSLRWTSTTSIQNSDEAWGVSIVYGGVGRSNKSTSTYLRVWPVRVGQSGIADSAYPANIWKTGQTTSFYAGDDGDLEKGVSWPSPRFTDNGNGTVTDSLTGLNWLKNANCFGAQIWSNAVSAANNLENGQCDLSDGSIAGAWRLPNKDELHSLTDFSQYNPALPVGHPFANVQSINAGYWSSTALAGTGNAWTIHAGSGAVGAIGKTSSEFYYGWPVRGGILTTPIDTTPDTFTFNDQTGVALNTLITSNSITVSGINAPAPISITGGEYSINGGVFASSAGTVNNGDTVRVRQTSSSSYSTTTKATLTIGGVSGTFSVMTMAMPIVCNDNNACTGPDHYDSATGLCVYPPLTGTACDDGNLCTENDKCTYGTCAGTPKPIDDGNVCTTDACDPLTGNVTHTPVTNGTPCDDYIPATLNDVCTNGTCVGTLKANIFYGFFSPIDNPPSLNTANSGQTIPVKWRITDANGAPVSNPASFKNLTSYSVNCDSFSGNSADAIEEYAAGSSGLQYLGDGNWQFNWKTVKTYARQCRMMVLTLGDNSTQIAHFKFK